MPRASPFTHRHRLARQAAPWRDPLTMSNGVPAATVVLVRDGADGLETLLLRRNSKIAFGGMWVFPGGRIDESDWRGVGARDELAAAPRAAGSPNPQGNPPPDAAGGAASP